jgi:hypothetical protein
MYAGLLPMDHEERHGEIMFWLFASRVPLARNTLTIWFNGGPGCSSFNGGVFFENSPVTVPLRPAGECCADANVPFQYNRTYKHVICVLCVCAALGLRQANAIS